MKIKELLANPRAWTKGVLARDSYGVGIAPRRPDAKCWCLMGALIRCYDVDSERHEALQKMMNLVFSRSGMTLTQFNDRSTHEQVARMLEEVNV